MTVSEAPDSERAIRHTRLEPSSSLPHPKLPPRSQHADNRTQCEVYRERDPETDSGYGFEIGSRRLLINRLKNRWFLAFQVPYVGAAHDFFLARARA